MERREGDPTRRARVLLRKLRGLKQDDCVEITLDDAALLDRGLCALIDCYASATRKEVERISE